MQKLIIILMFIISSLLGNTEQVKINDTLKTDKLLTELMNLPLNLEQNTKLKEIYKKNQHKILSDLKNKKVDELINSLENNSITFEQQELLKSIYVNNNKNIHATNLNTLRDDITKDITLE